MAKLTSNKAKQSLGNNTKVNPIKKPRNMSLIEWQKALRRQAAKAGTFAVSPVNNAQEGYFHVTNPQSMKIYNVVFRGPFSQWNYCSCPDFHTNMLGTCKHIEAVAIAKNGTYANKHYHLPDRTSIYVDYTGERKIKIRYGGPAAYEIEAIADPYFTPRNVLRDKAYSEFGIFLDKAKALDPNTVCFPDALDLIIDHRQHQFRNKIADSTSNLTDGLLSVRG